MYPDLPVIAIYTAILALIFAWLTTRTIGIRRKLRIAIGDNGNAEMIRAMRVHSNFAEYVPITLLVIYFVEISGAHLLIVHGLALCLLVGRCLHIYGVSQTSENFKFRTYGMGITLASLNSAAIYLLVLLALNILGA